MPIDTVRVPYDVSAETFSIVAPGETAQTAERTISPEDGSDEPKHPKRWDDRTTGGTQRQVDRKDPGSSRPAPAAVRRASKAYEKGAKTMSGVPVTGTFYVYAFDGRLLAEYDVLGLLVREYIYFGGQLVAEYRNQESRLLYYASDQINSTRIVTDNNGTVVYSAAHEPYGGIQKTWVSSYDPSLKFSGQQRDAESDLDYFGARYYDKTLYRFLSVDPFVGEARNSTEPQSWNCYSYCQNDPIGRVEIQGLYSLTVTVENVYRLKWGNRIPGSSGYMKGYGLTLLTRGEIGPFINSNGKKELAFELKFDVYMLEDSQLAAMGKDPQAIWGHEIACHVCFVGQWVSLSLARIEKKWQKEMKTDPDKALENAYNRLKAASMAAERLSRLIFDDEVTGILEGLYRYWEGINNDWITWKNDAFMTWALGVPSCI